jgi:hypothetical protein
MKGMGFIEGLNGRREASERAIRYEFRNIFNRLAEDLQLQGDDGY